MCVLTKLGVLRVNTRTNMKQRNKQDVRFFYYYFLLLKGCDSSFVMGDTSFHSANIEKIVQGNS